MSIKSGLAAGTDMWLCSTDYFLKQFKFMIGSTLYKTGQLRLISRKENFIIFM